jgi:hypothetical protein
MAKAFEPQEREPASCPCPAAHPDRLNAYGICAGLVLGRVEPWRAMAHGLVGRMSARRAQVAGGTYARSITASSLISRYEFRLSRIRPYYTLGGTRSTRPPPRSTTRVAASGNGMRSAQRCRRAMPKRRSGAPGWNRTSDTRPGRRAWHSPGRPSQRADRETPDWRSRVGYGRAEARTATHTGLEETEWQPRRISPRPSGIPFSGR